MFIGASKDCEELCLESSRGLYERDHDRQKHTILDFKSFKGENEDYILKVQKTWSLFDRELRNYFVVLRKRIDEIEKKAQDRLLEEELKTAVNSNDRRAIELSRDVFNEKFKKLTCREIE
jgi:hypothetical protein